jgi:hypothetical protein
MAQWPLAEHRDRDKLSPKAIHGECAGRLSECSLGGKEKAHWEKAHWEKLEFGKRRAEGFWQKDGGKNQGWRWGRNDGVWFGFSTVAALWMGV